MVHTLKVHKGSHPVQLTFDEQGLRIEGDLNAATKCNSLFVAIATEIIKKARETCFTLLTNSFNEYSKINKNCLLYTRPSW